MSANTEIKTLDEALDEAYPAPDSPHTSVVMRSALDRTAFLRGWAARDAEVGELRIAQQAAHTRIEDLTTAANRCINDALMMGQPDSGRDAALSDSEIDAIMAQHFPRTKPTSAFRNFARAMRNTK